MLKNLSLPFIFLVVCLVLVGGWFVLNNKPEVAWKGFYYKNAEMSLNLISQTKMFEQAPVFSTLQDCMKWGRDYLRANSSDGFECSYGCKVDDLGLICKDTTKMITNIKNDGSYAK